MVREARDSLAAAEGGAVWRLGRPSCRPDGVRPAFLVIMGSLAFTLIESLQLEIGEGASGLAF